MGKKLAVFKKIVKISLISIWELIVVSLIVAIWMAGETGEAVGTGMKILTSLFIAFFVGIVPFAFDWKRQHKKQMAAGVPKNETTIYKKPFKRIVSSIYGILFLIAAVIWSLAWQFTQTCDSCNKREYCRMAQNGKKRCSRYESGF